MISVHEAKSMILTHVPALTPVLLPLKDAAGCVLAETVFAPIDMPSFRQSAMDGYAFNFGIWDGSPLKVGETIAAGDAGDVIVEKGRSVRIFTGAPVPAGADTVVMQEKTKVEGGQLYVLDEGLEAGSNVRPVGSEIKMGSTVLKKEQLLTPGAIGFLATLGIAGVCAYPKPRVALLVTGKELQKPGTSLLPGQVYEANSYSLAAALQSFGIIQMTVAQIGDVLAETATAIETALANADLVLITGGISVGDYDYVLPALLQCGVAPMFHKVAQRPGKPLFFGMKDRVPVFGLPGNPASVLTCFYQYVVPALSRLMQKRGLQKKLELPLTAPVHKKPGLTQFLKGATNGASVGPLGAQESFRLSSFAQANCLIEIPEGTELLGAGELVWVYLL